MASIGCGRSVPGAGSSRHRIGELRHTIASTSQRAPARQAATVPRPAPRHWHARRMQSRRRSGRPTAEYRAAYDLRRAGFSITCRRLTLLGRHDDGGAVPDRRAPRVTGEDVDLGPARRHRFEQHGVRCASGGDDLAVEANQGRGEDPYDPHSGSGGHLTAGRADPEYVSHRHAQFPGKIPRRRLDLDEVAHRSTSLPAGLDPAGAVNPGQYVTSTSMSGPQSSSRSALPPRGASEVFG